MTEGPASGGWAGFGDVRLVRSAPIDLDARPELRQAVADGIERGFDGELPSLPDASETYLLRAHGSDVGLMALLADCPRVGDVAVVALAVDPVERGNAYATKALIAAERRLRRDGGGRLVTRVPRTNGRGLYFMLRVGFTPVQDVSDREDATWFARGGSR